jgi:hypothetical protein
MQKLVTIDIMHHPSEYGRVREHLVQYLEHGWQIKDIKITNLVPVIEDGDTDDVVGVAFVILEK